MRTEIEIKPHYERYPIRMDGEEVHAEATAETEPASEEAMQRRRLRCFAKYAYEILNRANGKDPAAFKRLFGNSCKVYDSD